MAGVKPWTNKQERTLLVMYQNGREASEIAEALNRSTFSVRAKARALGFSFLTRRRTQRIFTCPV